MTRGSRTNPPQCGAVTLLREALAGAVSAFIPRPAAERPAESGRRAPPRPRRVLCVTPLGLHGRGGIDRLYLYLRGLQGPVSGDLTVRYAYSRGEAPGPLWIPVFPWRLARFAAVMATWKPDLVHINFANGGSLLRKLAMVRVAGWFECPVVVHFHCVFPVADVEARRPAGRIMLAICRAAAGVVVIGGEACRNFVDHGGVPPDRIHVIFNGSPDIGAQVPLPKPRAPVRILFAGQVGARKGTAVVVAALAQLRDLQGWTCTIAGDGKVEACRAEIAAAGLGDRVSVTGWLAAEGVHALMREADIVVLPSEREVMPMSLIEGAAAGAALLATPVGEIRDVVLDGQNGYLIDRDPDTLAGRLRGLVADPDALARMQLASRALYDRSFRIEVFAARIADLYRSALFR